MNLVYKHLQVLRHTTHVGNFKVAGGPQPKYLQAKTVPTIKDKLISEGQLALKEDVSFKRDNVYMSDKSQKPPNGNIIGTKKEGTS